MPPQLSRRCAVALLAAILLAGVVGLLALGPLPGPDGAERYADPRRVAGLPNVWGVLWQLPLLAVTLVGAWQARRHHGGAPLQVAWALFFATAALATLVCMLDHLAPSPTGLVLSQAPAASAGALLSLIFLAERLGLAWVGRVPLALALAGGPLGAALWLAGMAWGGTPDARLLLGLQYLPVLLVPLAVWSLPSRGLSSLAWIVALLWFALAEGFDAADNTVWQASGGFVGGHALHHLPLAACLGWLAWCVARQRAAPARMRASAGSASRAVSQASTSLNTSG